MPRRVFGYCLLGVILGSPLLLTGGNEALFTVLLGLMLLLSFLFLLIQPIEGALKVPLRLFLVFIGWQLLTLIPIPVAWIRWLSPGLHEALLNFPEVAVHTLSWDAILTMKTLAVYVAAGGIFLVVYHLWRRPLERIPLVVGLFFWTGTIWAGVSLLLHATTPGRVPLLPWQPEPWFFGLFTNGNIFGSFCAMLIPLGIVTGISYYKRRQTMPGAFPIPFLGVGLLGFCIYAGRSLGAAIAAAAALLLLFCPWKRFMVPALVLGIALFGHHAMRSLGRESEDSLEARVRYDRMGVAALARMPVAGSGLGTMEIVGPFCQEPAGNRIVDKLHNDWLELAATAGLSSLLLGGCLCVLVWRSAFVSSRTGSLRAGIACALLVPAIHSLVDFPLQNFTVLASACALAAILARVGAAGTEPTLRGDRVIVLLLLASGLAVAGMLAFGLARTGKGRMSAWQPYRSLSARPARPDGMEGFLARHRLMAAPWGEVCRLREGSNDFAGALDALGRAVALQPRNPVFRLMEARLQFILGREKESAAALTEAFAITPEVDTLTVPLSAPYCGELFEKGLSKAFQYYRDGAEGHLWPAYAGAGRQCPAIQPKLARLAVSLLPDNSRAHNLLSTQLLAEGAPENAFKEAERAFGIARNAQSCLLAARAAAAVGDDGEAVRWLRRGLGQTGKERNRWLAIAGVQSLSDRSLAESAAFLQEAYNAHPDAFTALELARRMERMRRMAEAVVWYETALRNDGTLELAYIDYLKLLKSTGDPRRREVAHRARRHFPGAAWLED